MTNKTDATNHIFRVIATAGKDANNIKFGTNDEAEYHKALAAIRTLTELNAFDMMVANDPIGEYIARSPEEQERLEEADV